jgi:small nuclear ribonucleoprotein (snRNP)-like protein
LLQQDLLMRLVPPERVVLLLATSADVRSAILTACDHHLNVVLECKRSWQGQLPPDFSKYRGARVELRVSHLCQLRVVCDCLASALASGWAGVRQFQLRILETRTLSSRRLYRILFRQHEALRDMQRYRKTAGVGWCEESVPDDGLTSQKSCT